MSDSYHGLRPYAVCGALAGAAPGPCDDCRGCVAAPSRHGLADTCALTPGGRAALQCSVSPCAGHEVRR